MFAYCNNNPIIGEDPSGEFTFTVAMLTAAAIGGITGAVIGAISAASTGGDVSAVLKNAAIGGLSGAAIGLAGNKAVARLAVSAVVGVVTFVDCLINDISFGGSLLCAGVATATTYSAALLSSFSGDTFTSTMVDCTIGFGANLVSSGVSAGVAAANNNQKSANPSKAQSSGTRNARIRYCYRAVDF